MYIYLDYTFLHLHTLTGLSFADCFAGCLCIHTGSLQGTGGQGEQDSLPTENSPAQRDLPPVRGGMVQEGRVFTYHERLCAIVTLANCECKKNQYCATTCDVAHVLVCGFERRIRYAAGLVRLDFAYHLRKTGDTRNRPPAGARAALGPAVQGAAPAAVPRFRGGA